jgi:hypothetical protein
MKGVCEALFEPMLDGLGSDFGMWIQNNSACLVVKLMLERFNGKLWSKKFSISYCDYCVR